MQDITLKPTTLRQATAEGRLSVPSEVATRVREGRVAKGDVAAVAEVAGLMAVKKTSDWLPHCHPLPILDARITVTVMDDALHFRARVSTLAATGVEMEALAAVSAAALCAYDMLKPYAEPCDLRIGDIHLLEKTGGKSDFARRSTGLRAALIHCADAVVRGLKTSQAPTVAREWLERAGFEIAAQTLVEETPAQVQAALDAALAQEVSLILTLGSTGPGPRDCVVDVVRPRLDVDLPGVMEAARSFGQARTPNALLSRGVAGLIGRTVIVTLPGSTAGVRESLAAILPGLIHTIETVRRSYSDSRA